MRIYAITFALATTLFAAAPGLAQENDLVKYCKADIERLCAGIAPGGGGLMKCLKSHTKEMSVGCAQALQKIKG